MLRNEVGLRHPTGELESKRSSLVAYGEPGGLSAMARAVGYPAAIAARMLLDGECASALAPAWPTLTLTLTLTLLRGRQDQRPRGPHDERGVRAGAGPAQGGGPSLQLQQHAGVSPAPPGGMSRKASGLDSVFISLLLLRLAHRVSTLNAS